MFAGEWYKHPVVLNGAPQKNPPHGILFALCGHVNHYHPQIMMKRNRKNLHYRNHRKNLPLFSWTDNGSVPVFVFQMPLHAASPSHTDHTFFFFPGRLKLHSPRLPVEIFYGPLYHSDLDLGDVCGQVFDKPFEYRPCLHWCTNTISIP